MTAQPGPLENAKFVLLVDDREAEPRKARAFIEQRVRADEEVRLGIRERVDRSFPGNR